MLRNILFLLLYTVIIEISHFLKSNYQITEMEQQILKAINHIKYVSKKGVTIAGIQRFSKKKNLPPPLTKPLWEKLYAKCNKLAKLTANSKS